MPHSKAVEYRYKTFAKELFLDFSPSAAYLRAYPQSRPAVAWANSCRLLKKASVQEYLRAEFSQLQERFEIQQDRLFLEICRLGYSDLRGAATWGPGGLELKESSDLSADMAAAISEVQSVKTTRTVYRDDQSPIVDENVRTRIKLHPKTPALKMLQEFFRRGDPLSQEAEAKVHALLAIMEQYVSPERLAAFRAHVLATFDIELAAVNPQTERAAQRLAQGSPDQC